MTDYPGANNAERYRRAWVNFETRFNDSGRSVAMFDGVLPACAQSLSSCTVFGKRMNQTSCCDLFRYVPTAYGVCVHLNTKEFVQKHARRPDNNVQFVIAFDRTSKF